MVRSIVCASMLFGLTACSGSGSEAPIPVPLIEPSLACPDPAPLLGEPAAGGEDNYFVCFKDGVDVAEETARLAALYGFTPKYVYAIIPCCSVRDLPDETVATLRCEPTVDHLSYDGSLEPL